MHIYGIYKKFKIVLLGFFYFCRFFPLWIFHLTFNWLLFFDLQKASLHDFICNDIYIVNQ